MIKIKHLIPVVIPSLILTFSFAYAYDASGTIDGQGYLMPVINEKETIAEEIVDEDQDFEIDGSQERSNDDRALLISQMTQVYSSKDLRAFVRYLVRENKNIKGVNSEEDRVSITRDMPTKLFGFILLNTEETAEVISWGKGAKQVDINRPWWSIISKEEIASDTLSADIELRLKNIPTYLLKATLDPNTKAFILSEIHAAFITNSYGTSTSLITRP